MSADLADVVVKAAEGLRPIACAVAVEVERLAESAPDAATRRELLELAARAQQRCDDELCASAYGRAA